MKYLQKEWKNQSYGFWVKTIKNALWIHYKGQTWLWYFKPTEKKQKKEVQKLREKNIFSHARENSRDSF